MKMTYTNKDYIEVNEDNYLSAGTGSKIHLIKLNFKTPTIDLIKECISLYKDTNRYVISDNIKFYNSVLKNTAKKYYIENYNITDDLISFLRKNNKILINFSKLSVRNKEFLFANLRDLLENIEVCKIYLYDFETYRDIFEEWNGNVIIL